MSRRIKLSAGLVPYPEPMMDWERIRLVKIRCEHRCAEFDHVSGSCRLGLMPTENCPHFRLQEFSVGVEVDSVIPSDHRIYNGSI